MEDQSARMRFLQGWCMLDLMFMIEGSPKLLERDNFPIQQMKDALDSRLLRTGFKIIYSPHLRVDPILFFFFSTEISLFFSAGLLQEPCEYYSMYYYPAQVSDDLRIAAKFLTVFLPFHCECRKLEKSLPLVSFKEFHNKLRPSQWRSRELPTTPYIFGPYIEHWHADVLVQFALNSSDTRTVNSFLSSFSSC
jgi:hypothetical protein